MISPHEREHAEKSRSAFAASKRPKRLKMAETTIRRYLAPPENVIEPLEYAFHLLGDVRGKTILEYGSGDGKNTVILSRMGAKVVALDISPELLELARERLIANDCTETTFVLGSGHALPLHDESVDIVFGIAILHHLDLEMASREVQRVLKKGGRAIFQEPVRNSKVLARLRGLFPARADASPLERPLTDKELQDFTSPLHYRARTFHLILSRLALFAPFYKSRTKWICETVDATLLRYIPSLSYYGAIKVFEMAKR